MRFPRIPTSVYLVAVIAAAAVLAGGRTDDDTRSRLTRLESRVREIDRYNTLSANLVGLESRLRDAARAVTASSPGPSTLAIAHDAMTRESSVEYCAALVAAKGMLDKAVHDLRAKIAELEGDPSAAEELEQAKNQLALLAAHLEEIEALCDAIDEEVKAEREAGGDTSMVSTGSTCADARSELVSLIGLLESFATDASIVGTMEAAGGH